jgi:hypothetical protein
MKKKAKKWGQPRIEKLPLSDTKNGNNKNFVEVYINVGDVVKERVGSRVS